MTFDESICSGQDCISRKVFECIAVYEEHTAARELYTPKKTNYTSGMGGNRSWLAAAIHLEALSTSEKP